MDSFPLKLSTYLDEITKHLDKIPKIEDAPIKIALYATDYRYSIFEIFNEWKPIEYGETSMQKITETEKYCLHQFNAVFPSVAKKQCPQCKAQFFPWQFNKNHNEEIIYFLSLKNFPFIIVITNSHFDESRYIFAFFDKYYPFMTRILLRANQLSEILKKIEKDNVIGEEVYSIDFILKKYHIYDASEKHFDKAIERHFKKIGFEMVFHEAKVRGLWLDNITFKSENEGRVQLSRDGKIQYYDKLVFSNILPIIDLVVDTYSSSYSLFRKSERNNELGTPSLIKITLDGPVFIDNETTESFIKYIGEYEDSALTILSRNGIFFESSIIDYKTGSSFDICIYDSKIITIIPQFQMTTVSLIRMVSYILGEYDGKIES